MLIKLRASVTRGCNNHDLGEVRGHRRKKGEDIIKELMGNVTGCEGEVVLYENKIMRSKMLQKICGSSGCISGICAVPLSRLWALERGRDMYKYDDAPSSRKPDRLDYSALLAP